MCKLEKPWSEYYIVKSGRRINKPKSACKSCHHILALNSKDYHKNYQLVNAVKIKNNTDKWYEENWETIQSKKKIKHALNREEDNRKLRAWYEKNKVARNKINVARKKERCKLDPVYKVKVITRSLISDAICRRGFKKHSHTKDIIGCTFEELKLHIEKQFKPGMNWSNHSRTGWHIDHIIPMASAKTMEEAVKLNHFTNLQPLWAIENMKKKAKINVK
jgi:hypothetical protein